MSDGTQGGVVDVVGIGYGVVVPVDAVGSPTGRDELEGSDGAIESSISIEKALIGVVNAGGATRSVEDRAEGRRDDGSVLADGAVGCMVGLDSGDGGKDLPAEPALAGLL